MGQTIRIDNQTPANPVAAPAAPKAVCAFSDAVQTLQRDMATEFIAKIPRYQDRYSGRGIVVVGGGKYFVSAFVTIRVLRRLGCQLPIEIWHLSDEIDAPMRELLRPLNVTCRNADAVAWGSDFKFIHHWWKGWQLKPFALLHSSFEEVLLLDADSYPVRNPEDVFDWPQYRERGAVFWPDVDHSNALVPDYAWHTFGVDPIPGQPTESGQLLINKHLCWRELNLALHYNHQAGYVYRILYGDKDTYPLAWQRLGRRFARMWPCARFDQVAIRQKDYRGQTLFLHRVHDKFRLPNTRFPGTPQYFGGNQFIAEFPHEEFCHSVVSDLFASGFDSELMHDHAKPV